MYLSSKRLELSNSRPGQRDSTKTYPEAFSSNGKCELSSFQVLTLSGEYRSASSEDPISTSDEHGGPDNRSNASEKMKKRFVSIWNNMKYGGWTVKFKNNLSLDSPIWLLGICYAKPSVCASKDKDEDQKENYNFFIESDSSLPDDQSESTQAINKSKKLSLVTLRSNIIDSNPDVPMQILTNRKQQLMRTNSTITQSSSSSGSLSTTGSDNYLHPFASTPAISAKLVCCSSATGTQEMFRHDFHSRLWMTYRKDFAKISGSTFTSDAGWGCMLRSGQMMLAQALICHFLNRDWRWTGSKSDKEDMIHRMLVKWFADDNSAAQCPFSIHQLVKHGINMGKKPGDWYGPSSVAYILKDALTEATRTDFVLDGICIYVAQDCTVYTKDLIKMCTSTTNDQSKFYAGTFCKNERALRLKDLDANTVLCQSSNSFANTRRKCRNSLKALGSSFELAAESQNRERHSIEAAIADKRPVRKISSSLSMNDLVVQISKHKSHDDRQTKSADEQSDTGSSSGGSSSAQQSQQQKQKSDQKSKEQQKSLDESNKWKSVILLIPLRLGGEKFNRIYASAVAKLFNTPLCIGIIGGKPKHSLYFIGCQDDKLIYLDPHYSQETVDVTNNNFPLDSYHCSTTRKMLIKTADPSCTIGFYCKTRQDLDNLIEFTRNELTPTMPSSTSSGSGSGNKHQSSYPIFVFNDEQTSAQSEHLSLSQANAIFSNIKSTTDKTQLNVCNSESKHKRRCSTNIDEYEVI